MKKVLLGLGCLLALGITGCGDAAKKDDKKSKGDTTAVKEEKKEKKQLSQEEINQNWANYMTKGEMHAMIAAQAGKWNEEITMWMDPSAPPTTSTAVCESKLILDSLYLQTTHTGTFEGMPFNGISTAGYDNAKKAFVSSWVDNFGSGILTMEGTYDKASKTLTMKGKCIDPGTGEEKETKEITKYIDDDNFTMQMFDIAGGKEVKVMECKFTRIK